MAILVLLIHAGALAVIPPLSIPWWIKMLLAVLVLASAVYNFYYRVMLRSKRAVVGLVWDAKDEWRLTTAQGDTLMAELLPDTYVHPQVVILRFRDTVSRKKLSVILFPDSVDAETHRRLRVRLNINK
ncbi:MAG: hypothetical protein HY275_19745 [Gemmatimonadetes bacterium]|nr:hypothetical protein [Gemmatimonadota bacterium]